MGAALRKLGWRRGSYVVSTKIFWGLHDGPNEKNTLNRKRLREGIDGALKRFGLDYIDLVFCHRPDPETPIEETVWSMHMMVESGKALYWGTSEWNADQIMEACMVAEKHHLHKPQMEQPQYNLFVRHRVEQNFARLYDGIGLGLTTWSPLASGVLTGKYNAGIPKDSRLALPGYEWLHEAVTPARIAAVKKLQQIAADLGRDRGAARPGLVRVQSARQHRHHGREQARAGEGEHEGPRGPSEAHPRGEGEDRGCGPRRDRPAVGPQESLAARGALEPELLVDHELRHREDLAGLHAQQLEEDLVALLPVEHAAR